MNAGVSKICLIDGLPTDLLFIIFSEFLEVELWPALAQVCSWSNTIVQTCWNALKNTDLGIFPLLRPSGLTSIMKRCRHVQKLRIDCTYLKWRDLRILPDSIVTLELESSDNLVTYDEFWNLLSVFPALVRLKITTLDDKKFFVDISKINQAFSLMKLKRLELQRLYMVDRINPHEAIIFPETLKVLKVGNLCIQELPSSLEYLHIRCHVESRQCLGLNSRSITTILDQCPSLKGLSFKDYTLDVTLSDSVIQKISMKYPNLSKLKLSRYYSNTIRSVSDISVMHLGTSCKSLQSLSLDSFSKITDAGVIEILNQNQSLTSISLSYCYITDDTLQALRNLDLKHLNLKNCKRVTQEGLIRMLGSLSNLNKLVLSHTNGVTDEVIYAIEENCPAIEELWVADNEVTASGLRAISNLGHLKHLYFSSEGISDFSAFYPERLEGRLAGKFAGLISLSLSRCKLLQDIDVKNISLDSPLLTKLNLEACNQLTDKAFKWICKKLKRLRYLNVAGIPLSINVHKYIPMLSRNIKMLKISNLQAPLTELTIDLSYEKFKLLEDKNGHISVVKFTPSNL